MRKNADVPKIETCVGHSITLVTFLFVKDKLQVNQININISIAGFFHNLQESKKIFLNIPAHFEVFLMKKITMHIANPAKSKRRITSLQHIIASHFHKLDYRQESVAPNEYLHLQIVNRNPEDR